MKTPDIVKPVGLETLPQGMAFTHAGSHDWYMVINLHGLDKVEREIPAVDLNTGSVVLFQLFTQVYPQPNVEIVYANQAEKIVPPAAGH